jgi:PAS domain S-box-containing protein
MEGMPVIAERGTGVASIATMGDLGKLIAQIDDNSPLGPPDCWSSALSAAVRMILPSRAEIVMFWGPEYCALYNDEYAPTIGDKHPRALGQSAKIWWGELWDDLGPLLQGVRDTGETYHAKDRPFYIERDGGRGEEVFFDISYSPVFDDDGSVGGVLCIVSETTARVLSERQALADRNRLWNLARDPFMIASQDGTWLHASPAWTNILGWELDELTGRTSEWIEHPEDRERTREEVAHIASGETTFRFENRFRAKDGDYRWFSWTAVPEGELMYCVARDITAEREAAATLRETEEALRQSQKMETVGQLTGGVAHDFNNLLQVVTGNLDILIRNLPEGHPRLARAAQAAMIGAERAATLTQRLLAFARRQPLDPRRIDPDRLIAGMSDMLSRTIGETIEVEIVRTGRVWPVEVDPNQLENAIINLAINARDAMPDGGKLTIETANTHLDKHYVERDVEVTPGQYVVICISDTGEGMDDDTIAHAFEPFFTTKEVGRGTGLGLSMVYGFIKQSGGHVGLYSEPGHGTTVKLYLPRYFGPDAEPEEAVADHPVSEGQGETILVCEDDENVRAFTVEVLRELGYRVIEAGDGPAALAALDQAGQIDLLFTDVVLPAGMTGAQLASQAQSRRPGLKILYTTGYARNSIVHHGRLDPGVELLPKPFTYADLAARIRDLLDR